MSFLEHVPSSEWTPLNDLLEDVAEAWYRPDAQGAALKFQVPQSQFQASDSGERLTVEKLLMAASFAKDEVESWHVADDAPSHMHDLDHVLPAPSTDATHLTIYVRLKPPSPAIDFNTISDAEKWQALDAAWKAILGLEATIDALRLSMDGLRSEMENAFKKSLAVEDKVHALQADVLQWNKAKSRVHYALPKVREFIHRATWASGLTERKLLEDIVEKFIQPRVPFAEMDRTRERLEHLHKDRQVLLAQGNAVGQECRTISAEIQRALSNLQRNAAVSARKKREAKSKKGKYL